MDRSSNAWFRSIMANSLKEILFCKMADYLNERWEHKWSRVHHSIVGIYFSYISRTCDFGELHHAELFERIHRNILPKSSAFLHEIGSFFAYKFQDLFMVPRLKEFNENKSHIKKYQLVEVFIIFLLKLLYHKEDLIIDSYKDRIDNLEKELRLLLTILGDLSLVLCDEHEEFQNLLAEFEAVANEAGSLVHSLFFCGDLAFERMDQGLDAISNHIDLLKANIMEFLNLLPSISRSAYMTPKTSTVDSFLIVDSLIHDLEDLMNRMDNPITDVKDQIKILHHGLFFWQSSIKDIGSPLPSEIAELKEPLIRIGDLAHEAEYLIISFLVGDAPLWYLVNRLTDINNKIELIGTDLQEITKNCKFGGLIVAKHFSTQLSLSAKRNLEVHDITVGFEDKAIHILDHLVGGTKRLQVISIFGMPGIGKTTLAKKLYNHPTINYWFDKHSWCVVSQIYQRKSTLTNILIHIASEHEKDSVLQMEEESLVERIYKTLKGRRYLIVMDDIWDSNVWCDLQRCFPDDGNGSRILFTSRNKDVAPPNSMIYAQPSLSNDQCWELLEKKVFDSETCPPELKGIGKKIAANCCGLPLTVVVIAGILSTMDKEKSTWEEVGGNLAKYIFDGRDNLVMQILELSYKHLPGYLKPCFLYFGAFEEDREIPVGTLMRLWIAEGFVRKQGEKNAENVAEEYLMELIDKSLVMVAKRRSDGGVKACVIHDLLRDMCLKRSEEENFLKFMKSEIYSIYEEGPHQQELQCHETSVYSQHVRSFHGGRLSSPLYVRDMRLLRFLHFDYTHFHFIGIEFLVYLRYLIIRDLPASIGSLVNLEYLRVESNGTVYLPPAVLKMMKLRYIRMGRQAIYDKDCNSSQKNNLEFISGVCVRGLKDEEILKCSPKLRKLKCSCYRFSMIDMAYEQFDFHFLTQLEALNLSFHIGTWEKVIFPSNIKKLTLSGLSLSYERISIIGRLEKLKVLKLSSLPFVHGRWDTIDGEFQKLRFLKLDQIKNLTQWNVGSSEHFPKLQRLVLSDCRKLQEIPSEIGEIATLQLIEVKGEIPMSLVMSAKRIQHEQRDMGNEELRVIAIPQYFYY